MTIETPRFAGTIDEYLHRFFCDEATLARLSGIDVDRLRALIAGSLVPKAAYVVADGVIVSHVFGQLGAPDAPPGHWFSKANAGWVRRASDTIADCGEAAAGAALKARFESRYRDALRASHFAEGPLPGLSCADGGFDEAGYDAQFDAVWTHFLAGTFSLCVRDAVDETRIAEKETLQLRLSAATDGGTKTRYSNAETQTVRSLIARYIEASMPFSPIEYPLTSRRRLVEDVLPHLRAD
jgi:hypothetical protein